MRTKTHAMYTIYILCLITIPLIAQPPNELRIRIMQRGNIQFGDDMFSVTELSPTVYVEEVTGETRGQLDRLDQFLEKKQWNEALEMVVRLSDYQENKLVGSSQTTPTSKTFPQYVSVARRIDERLATLPAAAKPLLDRYREQIDPLASQWFEQAINHRDEKLLQRIVDELFHSSAADDALLALGELSLEKSHFGNARKYWQAIHPQWQWLSRSPKRLPYWLRVEFGEVVSAVSKDIINDQPHPAAYVDSAIPLADVWARFALCSILEGNLRRANAELLILRKLWPNAEGTMRGQTVNYRKTLTNLITQSRTWPARKTNNGDWTTFAGNASRNRTNSTAIDIAIEPTWTAKLKPMPARKLASARQHKLPMENAGESTQLASHFPIVVGQHVFIHDQDRLRCLNLANGKPAWTQNDDGAFYINESRNNTDVRFVPFNAEPGKQQLGEQRLTLSAHGDTVVATVGSQASLNGSGNSAILGFDIQQEGAVRFGPVQTDDARWIFQGAPLCDAHHCWVGLRLRDVTSQDYVACFDMRSGQERWRTRICSADTIAHNRIPELANHMLTLHEGTLYFSSHLGTIAAISADTGRLRWLTKYPRLGPKRQNLLDDPWHALRDLTPCLYHDGLLIVAPSDSDSIFALDANSGEQVWQTSAPSDATQLLGVGAGDHLIVSGRRLWWLNVYTGKPSRGITANPFPASVTAEPSGSGRGVLADGNIYWPTQADGMGKIYVFDQVTGKQLRQPIDLEAGNATAGNLLVTPTHLLIAAPNKLFAFELGEAK